MGWDIYRIIEASSCEKSELYRQFGIDIGAGLLDLLFLFLPGLTGAGPGLRLVLAGGGTLTDLARIENIYALGRIAQAWYKGLQLSSSIERFSSRSASGGGSANRSVRKGPIPDEAPRNLNEKLALEEAEAAEGEIIITELGDEPRLIANYGAGEWVKKQYVHRCKDNRIITIHWHENLTTGLRKEYKFANR
jgi:hypothetical protein